MIAKIAVSAANFAIDKPYSYFVPDEMHLAPGIRVIVPFGRGNHRTEGVVLSLEEGSQTGLKTVQTALDTTPVLNEEMLRMAGMLRTRYFCTFYDAIRAILPAGLWYRTKDTYALTEDRSWKEKINSRMRPSQKAGMDIPISVTTVVRVSVRVPACRAARMPIGMASSAAINRDVTASSNVLGSLVRYISRIFSPEMSDFPRSP